MGGWNTNVGWDQGYGIQTINQRGQSNAGQGPYQPQGRFTNPQFGMGQFVDPQVEAQQKLQQQRLMAQQQQAENAGNANAQWVQQQMDTAKPEEARNSWQMTPEKVAAYRAAQVQQQQQTGTSMAQQQGMSNGQLSGQQAIANLLRMLGLG